MVGRKECPECHLLCPEGAIICTNFNCKHVFAYNHAAQVKEVMATIGRTYPSGTDPDDLVDPRAAKHFYHN